RRQNLRQEAEESDFGMNLLENVLEIGMSTARAAIHLGRAFKNTK
ncbi:jg272, partial [Pararge aegeria aegeria]